MALGVILGKELRSAARRAQTYHGRMVLAVLMLGVIGAADWAWSYVYERQFTIARMALCAQRTFAFLTIGLGVLTLFLVPEMVGRALAEEREKGTLEALLLTRIAPWQIALGKAAAGLAQYLAWLVTALPVTALLALMGGVDPALVVLAFLGLASMAWFMAAVALWFSAGAQSGRRAVSLAVLAGWAWLCVPMLAVLLLPALWPALGAWFAPINAWLLASTPTGILLGLLGIISFGGLVQAVAWMVGLQLTAGGLLMALAVARFAAHVRAREEGRPRLLARLRQNHWRLWPRPTCGQNPVLWKELWTSGLDGLGRVVHLLWRVLVLAGVTALVLYLAGDAFWEVLAQGYGTRGDAARSRFNFLLRGLFGAGLMIELFVAAGYGAEGMTLERARGTWSSLLATPLEPRAILRAKRWGAIKRTGDLVALALGLLLAGLACGAVHPLGFGLGLALLAASAWFAAALGTFFGLRAESSAQATSAALGIMLLLVFSPASLWLLPAGQGGPLLGLSSIPFVGWLELFSYRDVDHLMSADPLIPFAGWRTWLPRWEPLVLGPVTLLVYALATVWLIRDAEQSFDRAVGRPVRAARTRRGSVMCVRSYAASVRTRACLAAPPPAG